MPRVGRHPLKNRDFVDKPIVYQDVTVTTIVYIPMLSGYWQESLEVLKLFFESLYANTVQPFDVMVFDNGSCEEVQNYLLDLKHTGKIQYLFFSQQNLRKLGALNFLLSSAPGEYIAYADSDVYFLPGWLEQSLDVLKAFPEAGQVTALPTKDKRSHYVQSTLCGLDAVANLDVERGELIPEAYIEAHRLSIGRKKDEYLRSVGPGEDIRLTRNDVSAYVSAQDFQYVTRREVTLQVLPLEVRQVGEYYDPIYSPVFETKVDEGGWWRLSTSRYLVHHMGNRLPNLPAELVGVTELSSAPVPTSDKESSALHRRILQSRPVRGILKRIYTWAYSLLFE